MERPDTDQVEQQIELKVVEPEPVGADASRSPSNETAPHIHANISLVRGCAAKWGDMQGDDCSRTCHICQFKVFQPGDVSLMELLAKQGDSGETKVFRRADGTYMLDDCSAQRSLPRAVWRDWYAIMTKPKQFFLNLPEEGLFKRSVLFYLIIASVENILRELVVSNSETTHTISTLLTSADLSLPLNSFFVPPKSSYCRCYACCCLYLTHCCGGAPA